MFESGLHGLRTDNEKGPYAFSTHLPTWRRRSSIEPCHVIDHIYSACLVLAILAVDLVLTSHFAPLEMHLSPTFMTTFMRHNLRLEHVLITCSYARCSAPTYACRSLRRRQEGQSFEHTLTSSIKSILSPKMRPSGVRYHSGFARIHRRPCIALYKRSSRLLRSFWSIDVLLILVS
jgi:hypothetical protein